MAWLGALGCAAPTEPKPPHTTDTTDSATSTTTTTTGTTTTGTTGTVLPDCPTLGTQDAMGQVTAPELVEISGVAASRQNPGVLWDDGWHNIKIIRKTADASIEVYFDDMTKPSMKTLDRTFLTGRIGLGSFDNAGNWDNIRIWGKKVDK